MILWLKDFLKRLVSPKLRLVDAFRLSILHDCLDKTVTLKPKNIRYPITLRGHTWDKYIFKQVFVQGEYDFEITGPVHTIIDAGANVGMASLIFANRFPDAKIIALEPESSNFESLQKTCGSIKNIELLRGGLWSRNCDLRISNPNATSPGFQVEPADEPGADTFPGYTVDALMRKYALERVDILKLDIEGGEKEIFSHDISAWIDRVRILVIELHDFMIPGTAEPVFSQIQKMAPYQFTLRGENLIFMRLED